MEEYDEKLMNEQSAKEDEIEALRSELREQETSFYVQKQQTDHELAIKQQSV